MSAVFDVAVVGGGFAGLSAATALAEAGRRVVVLEARPALGGRASTFVDPATGERVDNGQHALFGCYHETFAFLTRLGTAHHVHLQRALAIDIIDTAAHRTSLRCPAWPAPLGLLAGILSWRALPFTERLSALRMRAPIQALLGGDAGSPSLPLPHESVEQWLRRHGQAESLIRLLWEPLAVAALNQAIDVAGAGPFGQVLAGLFGGRPMDASLGLPRVPLDQLYAHPAREYLHARGGQVLCGAPARIVLGQSGGLHAVATRSERFEAAAVVCAVPWHAVGATLVDPPESLQRVVDALPAVGWSPIVTVNLWLDRPLQTGMCVGLPGRTFQWLFDKQALFGDGASHLSMVASAAGSIVDRTNDDIADLALTELKAAIPAAAAAEVRRVVVVRERRATFDLAPSPPWRAGVQTGVNGLYLAGDWIATSLPATIEGAVVSGHRAAAACLAAS